MFWRRVFIGLSVVILVTVLGGCGGQPIGKNAAKYTADWKAAQVASDTFVTTSAGETMPEARYKSACRHVSYKDFENNAKAYKGKDVYLAGWVTDFGQVSGFLPDYAQLDASLSGVTFGVGHESNYEYEDAVIVVWPGQVPSTLTRLGHGVTAYVEVWGESQGAYGPDPDSWPKEPVVVGRYLTVHTE
jgi:hypothetical protein